MGIKSSDTTVTEGILNPALRKKEAPKLLGATLVLGTGECMHTMYRRCSENSWYVFFAGHNGIIYTAAVV